VTAQGRVWITRAEPGATATAGRVQAIGLNPIVAPLLTVEALDTPLDLDGVAAIAFTSMNAVKAFAARSDWRGVPAFAVGDATAKAARRAGFAEVASADGEMIALIKLLGEVRPDGVVLHPRGRHQAGDFLGGLKRLGLVGRDVALYDTPAVEALPPNVAEALEEREVAAVLLHSPRAAEILAGLAGDVDFSETVAFGLSSHCLGPLKRMAFADLIKAKRPREDALVDALLAALGKGRGRR
jgi:uroporphyrinogen-III synthase